MKELILSVTKKDFDIQYFSGTGAGGQHRNKHKNCVRMTHKESGVSSTGQSSRSRQANTREAFRSIINSKEFKNWHRAEVAEIVTSGNSIRAKVVRMMKPENLRVESGPF